MRLGPVLVGEASDKKGREDALDDATMSSLRMKKVYESTE
jgi:hypothetical protein